MLCKTRTLVCSYSNLSSIPQGIIFDFDEQLKYDVQNSTKIVLFQSMLYIY